MEQSPPPLSRRAIADRVITSIKHHIMHPALRRSRLRSMAPSDSPGIVLDIHRPCLHYCSCAILRSVHGSDTAPDDSEHDAWLDPADFSGVSFSPRGFSKVLQNHEIDRTIVHPG